MSNGILARRQALGWTQKELAERASLAQSLVSDAENGRRANPRKVQKILDTLTGAEKKLLEFQKNRPRIANPLDTLNGCQVTMR